MGELLLFVIGFGLLIAVGISIKCVFKIAKLKAENVRLNGVIKVSRHHEVHLRKMIS